MRRARGASLRVTRIHSAPSWVLYGDSETEVPNMMWNYVQFPDETQVAYSDVREDGTVRIDIERPRDWGL